MPEIILSSNAVTLRPLPQVNVSIRPGVLSDVPFLDSLQEMHTKQVGWMPTKQFEGKIKLGHVLIAESDGEPVGYCIGNDQYFKRDDLGIIYQLNVAPTKQRGLIGATLLKAMFDRLVCMNGGNPREDLIAHKDPALAIQLEHSPEWEKLSQNHLEGRSAAFFCYCDG